MKLRNLWNHETYETTKPMKLGNLWNYEITKPMKLRNPWNHETPKTMKPRNLWNHETTKPMKPWNPWNHETPETYETTKPMKPRNPWNPWNHETPKTMKPRNLWNHETPETMKPRNLWNHEPHETTNPKKHGTYDTTWFIYICSWSINLHIFVLRNTKYGNNPHCLQHKLIRSQHLGKNLARERHFWVNLPAQHCHQIIVSLSSQPFKTIIIYQNKQNILP